MKCTLNPLIENSKSYEATKKGKIIQNRHYLRICFAQKKPIYKFLAIFWHVIFLDFFTLGDDP